MITHTIRYIYINHCIYPLETNMKMENHHLLNRTNIFRWLVFQPVMLFRGCAVVEARGTAHWYLGFARIFFLPLGNRECFFSIFVRVPEIWKVFLGFKNWKLSGKTIFHVFFLIWANKAKFWRFAVSFVTIGHHNFCQARYFGAATEIIWSPILRQIWLQLW